MAIRPTRLGLRPNALLEMNAPDVFEECPTRIPRRSSLSGTVAQRKSEKAPPIPATPAPRTFLQQLKRDLVG